MKNLAVFVLDLLRKIRADWFSWLAIIVGAVTIAVSSIAIGEAFAIKYPNPKTLDVVAVSWILLGALWTALGAHAAHDTRSWLEFMAQTGKFDPRKMAEMLLTNSRFATYGALMIVVGSMVLVVKLLLP